MSRSNYDDELAMADKFAGNAISLGLLGLFAVAKGIGALFQGVFDRTRPGPVIGRWQAGWQKPATVPWELLPRHLHVVGPTGSGKSTLIENLVRVLFADGCGVCVISPKSDLIERLLPHVPPSRIDDVILFDGTDTVRPLGINPLEAVEPRLRGLAASEVLTTFRRFSGDNWGPRLEHILRFSLLTLLDCPGTTLASIPRLLLDEGFRQQALTYVTNPMVRRFWEMEFAAMSPGLRAQAVQPILTRLSSLLSYPTVYDIVSQPQSSFSMAEVMDRRRLLLGHLPQGLLGEDVVSFLGGLLVNKIQLTAMERAGLPPERRQAYYLVIDEFQNFGSDAAFVKMFTEARAFGLSLVVAHQYPEQLSRNLLQAVEHNVGISLACQMENGVHTAIYREPQDPSQEERVLLPLPPLGPGDPEVARQIRLRSRLRYGRSRQQRQRVCARQQARRDHVLSRNVTLYSGPDAEQAPPLPHRAQ